MFLDVKGCFWMLWDVFGRFYGCEKVWSGLRHVCSCLKNHCVRPNNGQPPNYRAFQISFVGLGGEGKSGVRQLGNETIQVTILLHPWTSVSFVSLDLGCPGVLAAPCSPSADGSQVPCSEGDMNTVTSTGTQWGVYWRSEEYRDTVRRTWTLLSLGTQWRAH